MKMPYKTIDENFVFNTRNISGDIYTYTCDYIESREKSNNVVTFKYVIGGRAKIEMEDGLIKSIVPDKNYGVHYE